MISTIYANAMAEVLVYLEGIRQEDLEKIPENFMNYLKENANKDYVCSFDINDSFEKMNLLPESKAIITSICYSYWCTDEYEKQKLKEILNKNERDFDIEQHEKYNPDNMFKNDNGTKIQEESKVDSVALTVKKENFFVRIIEKIKTLFKRR